tara:strand:+ start:3033 stop:3572 length:540 start_codon:yes stop_codon:yes gene_type:complete
MDLDFNVMDYAPGNNSEIESKDYTLATPGKYKVEIIESSEEMSAAGNRYLKLKLSICDGGKFDGTWIWDNLNLYHPTESVQGLARQILGTITKSCGLVGCSDTSELHYKPLTALLDIEPEGDYPAKNVVKKYFPLDPVTVKEDAEKVTKMQLDQLSALPSRGGDEPKVDSEPIKDGIPF